MPCKAAFSLRKIDAHSGEPLADAVFELRCGERPLLSSKSDGAGLARFPCMPAGNYTLAETIPPKGYTAQPSAWQVCVQEGGTVCMNGSAAGVYTVTNLPDGT